MQRDELALGRGYPASTTLESLTQCLPPSFTHSLTHHQNALVDRSQVVVRKSGYGMVRAVLCASQSRGGAGRGGAGTAATVVVVTVVLAPKIGRSQPVLGLVRLPHGK